MAVQLGTINITNQAAECAVIDIEGIIGIPEWWQFDSPEDRVSTYDTFKARMTEIKAIAAPAIEVNIRSIGGNVDDALLIHDTLCVLGVNGATVTTNCYGYVASAATIIAQAASKGRRKISQNALYLIHQAGGIVQGNCNDLQQFIDQLSKTDNVIANVYANRSGRPAEEFATLMTANNGNGKWLDAGEVIAAGLADAVVPATETTNCPDELAVFGYAVPPAPQINNQQNTRMKINKTWNAILNYFGFDKEADNNLTEAQLEKLNNELEARGVSISNLTGQIETKDAAIANLQKQVDGIAAKDEQIVNLTAKVASLEAENEKLKAGPTVTEAKEDPDTHIPGAKQQIPANLAAYNEDVKAFQE